MPTILSHPAIPVALGLGLGRRAASGPLVAAGVVASMLPDADAIGFRLGVPYAAALGHRGFTHSLAFAAAVALVGASLARPLRSRRLPALAFLFVSAASHGALDAFTSGGLGVAFLWPFSAERWFAPARPILVAPIGLARMLSPRGAAVLGSELRWVWAPAALAGAALAGIRARAAGRRRQPLPRAGVDASAR